MAKILNLDALTPAETRELVLGGITYTIPEMTVENFILTTQAAQAIPKDATLDVQIEATVDMLVRSVPNLPREALTGVPLTTLSQIAAFVRGNDVPDQTDTSAPAPAVATDETPAADPASDATPDGAAPAGN